MAPDPEGFVKLWRRLLKHPLWKSANSNAKVLFIHILLTVNWKPGKWLYESAVVEIAPGERIGSSTKIAAELGLSRKEFRHAVQVLQELEILAKTPAKSTSVPLPNNQGTENPENYKKGARDGARDSKRRYTRLTLINWDRWQGQDDDDKQPKGPEVGPCEGQTGAREGPEKGQTGATIKEGKKLRREEQSTSIPVSSGKSPEETSSGFELHAPSGNWSTPKRPKKVKPAVQPIPPDIYEDWKTLLRTHPKQKFGAGIARRLFVERVQTKAQSEWLVAALRKEVASGEKFWGRFDAWLLDRLESMDASLSPEEASVSVDSESAAYEADIERQRQEDYARAAAVGQ